MIYLHITVAIKCFTPNLESFKSMVCKTVIGSIHFVKYFFYFSFSIYVSINIKVRFNMSLALSYVYVYFLGRYIVLFSADFVQSSIYALSIVIFSFVVNTQAQIRLMLRVKHINGTEKVSKHIIIVP
jgi:hypothetical protein